MTNEQTTTVPAMAQEYALTVVPEVIDGNGARWVHRDLVEVVAPWANEAHISPVKEHITLGDIESFAAYVSRFASTQTLITWTPSGLKAILDYHTRDQPGRAQWMATQPFALTDEWKAWVQTLCQGSHSHQTTVEFFEDHANDIDVPQGAAMADLIRSLKGISTAAVEATINSNGTTQIETTTDNKISVEIPAFIKIAIPVLKGRLKAMTPDVDLPPVKVPVLTEMEVRMRVSVDSGKVRFRFTIPGIERVFDKIIQERVDDAQKLLVDAVFLRGA